MTGAAYDEQVLSNSTDSLEPLRWLPEFWELSRKRLRPQVRMLGLALVVGIVAGLGAIVFTSPVRSSPITRSMAWPDTIRCIREESRRSGRKRTICSGL